MECTRCHFLNVSDAENVDEEARPQEMSPLCKHPFLACGVTEAAEVKVNIQGC